VLKVFTAFLHEEGGGDVRFTEMYEAVVGTPTQQRGKVNFFERLTLGINDA
jgi:hypothetical protein